MIYKTIEELTTVATGGTPSTSKAEYWENGNIPWLQSGCCQNCDVNQADKFISQSGYDNSSTQVMPVNTVMIALTGATAGKVGYLNIEACGNQSITGIFPCEELNPRFLFYFLISQRRKILVDCVGGAQAHISQGYVKKIKVPVYSKNIQERIVNIMNICSKNIKHYEMILKEYDELVKARFIEMFGDPIRNPYCWYNDCLNNVCTKINDGTHCSPESFDKGDYMYITAKNIKQNGLDLSNVTYVSEKVHKPIYQRCNPEFGDILYIKDGATTGIATINTMKNEFTLLSSVALLKYDRSLINGYYLIHLLNSKEMYSKIRKNMGGAAITRLTIAKIKEIKVIVPPIDLQNQFADFVQQVDKSRFDIKKSIIKLEREVVYD